MKREWVLLLTSATLTVTLALGLVRWLAPGLLGIPVDLQMVQVSDTLPPFFEGVFRIEDYKSRDFILKDPYTSVRAKPLFPELNGMGPNDILGFRNRQVPNVADVVVIGDSQTYGNNATLEQNWPSRMADHLELEQQRVYAMAVGGWGAVQYLEMFNNAVAFQPRVVVVAFYTGNDPLDSFLMAYSHERFRALRPNPRLSSADVPKVKFPAPESEWWPVKFEGGIETVFTPTLRFGANQNHEAIKAGYGVMAKVCEPISARAKSLGIATVFTIIPSKELVYWPKIRQAQIEVPEAYSKLIVAEQRNIAALAKRLKTLKNAKYVDAVNQLQAAAMGAKALYPGNINGHPLAAGYDVIGKAVAEMVGQLLPVPPQGLVALQVGQDAYQLYAVKGGEAWWFTSTDSVVANGWDLERASRVSLRELAGLEKRIVDGVDIRRFGPR